MTKRDREELNWWSAMAVSALVFEYGAVWVCNVDKLTGQHIWAITAGLFMIVRPFTLFLRNSDND